MANNEVLDLLVNDSWDSLSRQCRENFLTRRMADTGWRCCARPESAGRRWEPLRPAVIGERAYRGLESLTIRLLNLAVDACRRRASTLGELRTILRFRHDLPLMDPDGPLLAAELTRYARPDLLIEQGRPRLLEFNNSTRLGGDTLTPRLAAAYARLFPQSGLRPPPSTVTARSAALARMLRAGRGRSRPGRVLVPACWMVNSRTGEHVRQERVKPPVLADARRVGLDVIQADLSDLRLDAAGRLLAVDVPIDLVLMQWGSGRVADDGGGLAALRAADRAGTVRLFPRTESALIASKAILAWLHEDCDAGFLAGGDCALVRAHVPWTVCLGLEGDQAARKQLLRIAADERDRLVAKPAVGKSGNGVLFGNRTSERDWLAALDDATCAEPLVLQRRVESDHMTMPFRDQDSGRQVTARVPFVLSPFIVDGAAASVGLRHLGPDVPAGDVVISVGRGGCENTVLLAPERPAQPWTTAGVMTARAQVPK